MTNNLRLIYRNKETGKTSPQIYNVTSDVLTLNVGHNKPQNYLGEHSTMFKEIEVVPYSEAIPKNIYSASQTPRTVRRGESEFFKDLKQSIKNYIYKRWEPREILYGKKKPMKLSGEDYL